MAGLDLSHEAYCENCDRACWIRWRNDSPGCSICGLQLPLSRVVPSQTPSAELGMGCQGCERCEAGRISEEREIERWDDYHRSLQ